MEQQLAKPQTQVPPQTQPNNQNSKKRARPKAKSPAPQNNLNPYQSSQNNTNPYSPPPTTTRNQPLIQNINIKEPGPLDHLQDGLSGQARTAFIGKVYILLTIELLITFGICMISQYVEAYRQWQMNNAWFIAIPIVLIITVMALACCIPKARTPPLDSIMLLIFVLSFSYIMSFFCSAIVENSPNDSAVIPIAVAATVGIAAVLTIYAFVCKGNYVIWIGILLICVVCAIVVGVSAAFTNCAALVYVYCSLAIVIFGVYLVIITKSIIGGDIAQFPIDHPILASLFLYMYIMRIFLYILMILGLGGKK